MPTPADRGHGQVIENFQYGFEQDPICAHDDESQPIHKRLFVGPNTWPATDSMPGFKPLIEQLTDTYHELTHQLGELIVESLGEDPAEFRRYFDRDEPYLAASLNHNFSLDVFETLMINLMLTTLEHTLTARHLWPYSSTIVPVCRWWRGKVIG